MTNLDGNPESRNATRNDDDDDGNEEDDDEDDDDDRDDDGFIFAFIILRLFSASSLALSSLALICRFFASWRA